MSKNNWESFSGVKWVWKEKGQGKKKLLFLHGLTSSSEDWEVFIRPFLMDYRLYLLDIPGHGLNNPYDKPFPSIFQLHVSLLEFIEKIGDIEGIVAHSMGAQIALMCALTKPAVIKKLALFAPAGLEKFQDSEKEWLIRSAGISAQISAGLRRSFPLFRSLQTEAWLENHPNHNGLIAHYISSMLNQEVHPFLSTIQIPVLVVFGTEDELIPNRIFRPIPTDIFAVEACSQIPFSQLVLINNATHYPHVDFPKRCQLEVFKFLNK